MPEKKAWVLQQTGPARANLDPVAVIETEDEAKAVIVAKAKEMKVKIAPGSADRVDVIHDAFVRHCARYRSGVCNDNDFEWEAVAVPVMKPKG